MSQNDPNRALLPVFENVRTARHFGRSSRHADVLKVVDLGKSLFRHHCHRVEDRYQPATCIALNLLVRQQASAASERHFRD